MVANNYLLSYLPLPNTLQRHCPQVPQVLQIWRGRAPRVPLDAFAPMSQIVPLAVLYM